MSELWKEINKLHPDDDLKDHSDDYRKGFEVCKKLAIKLVEDENESGAPVFCPACGEEIG